MGLFLFTVCYARARSTYGQLCKRGRLLTTMWLEQKYQEPRLKHLYASFMFNKVALSARTMFD